MNIFPVIKLNRCTGCGICSAVCPHGCISTSLDYAKGYYITTINQNLCTQCGLCQKVCPVFTWNNNKGDIFVGEYSKIFSGYANDFELRVNCASGGITTSILLYLFKAGAIDAAVVASRHESKPLESKLRLVNTAEDIIESKGSVYAPTCYTDVLNELIDSDYKSIAVVGLPCHIQALDRLSQINKNIYKKIYIKIALVCGHSPSLNAYKYTLRHYKIKEADIKTISNRGDGWPGSFIIHRKNNIGGERDIKTPHGSKYSWGMVFSSVLYMPSGCYHCVDATGYNADFSICDAWLEKYKDDTKGRNLILTRNTLADEILKGMEHENLIFIVTEKYEDYIDANKSVFKQKLIINGIKNKNIKKEGILYKDMEFLHSNNFIATIFIAIMNFCVPAYLNIFGTKSNNIILFLFKALGYLSGKWLSLKKY
jgi:coenzyme F420 hydrogenase subunit beta